MCECAPSGSMPITGHWALRGGFTPRANPGRPNVHFPHHEMFRKPCDEIFVSFYHRSQESAKVGILFSRNKEIFWEISLYFFFFVDFFELFDKMIYRSKLPFNLKEKCRNLSIARYEEVLAEH